MNSHIFTQISQEKYNTGRADRLDDSQIQEDEPYLLRAELQTSRGVKNGEFALVADRVSQKIGSASLIAALYDTNTGHRFLTLEGTSEQGILLPLRPDGLHITHAETGSIGILQEGYLLSHPNVLAKVGHTALSTIPGLKSLSEPPIREYTDNRTASFSLQGITLGYN